MIKLLKNIEFQSKETIKPYNDYSETPEYLTYPSIFHIHGTSNSKIEQFV